VSDQEIAQTILQQLGGSRFTSMTGARSYTSIEKGLMFQLPARFAKNGINKVRIYLTPQDTYTVEFWKIGPKLKLSHISTHEDVYADSLRELFESQTGLYLTLGMREPDRAVFDPGMKTGPLAVGDKVAYSADFLRSVGAYTGPLGTARGTITKLEPFSRGAIMLATVDWHNPEIPPKVNVKNLQRRR
jgi:hypothetical protein